jgi:uncharacterized protein (TIGR02677 family)
VIDRTDDKKRLAELAKMEAEQLERARDKLATGQLTRLSDLGPLNRSEFQLFLDLLGKALAEQKGRNAEVVTTSADGALQIVMKPTEGNAMATIVTSEGTFRGRDHYIRISGLAETTQTPPASHRVIRDLRVAGEVYETSGRSNE